ncbi:MarR family transcriptional regulator [bacterium]|nr:MarR family transcriptional regulator [bacterium]
MANRALLSRDVLLDLLRLHEELLADVTALLKEHGVTVPQYNVLRILRGAGPGGLTGTGLAAAMITRVPDVTRLVDRLEKVGLVRGMPAMRYDLSDPEVVAKGIAEEIQNGGSS